MQRDGLFKVGDAIISLCLLLIQSFTSMTRNELLAGASTEDILKLKYSSQFVSEHL